MKQFLLLILVPFVALAEDGSFGSIANNAQMLVDAVGEVLFTVCYLLGIGVSFGGLVLIRKHRDNPSEVPLSRALVVLLLGIILILIPLGLGYYQAHLAEEW